MQSSVRQRDGGNGRAWAKPLSDCVPALPLAAPCCFDDNPPSVPLPGGLALCRRGGRGPLVRRAIGWRDETLEFPSMNASRRFALDAAVRPSESLQAPTSLRGMSASAC